MAVVNEAAAEIVRARLQFLRLDTYRQIEDATKVSNATWRPLIKRAEFPVMSHIKRKMATGLGWTAESFDLILAGADPLLLDGPGQLATPTPADIADLRTTVTKGYVDGVEERLGAELALLRERVDRLSEAQRRPQGGELGSDDALDRAQARVERAAAEPLPDSRGAERRRRKG